MHFSLISFFRTASSRVCSRHSRASTLDTASARLSSLSMSKTMLLSSCRAQSMGWMGLGDGQPSWECWVRQFKCKRFIIAGVLSRDSAERTPMSTALCRANSLTSVNFALNVHLTFPKQPQLLNGNLALLDCALNQRGHPLCSPIAPLNKNLLLD